MKAHSSYTRSSNIIYITLGQSTFKPSTICCLVREWVNGSNSIWLISGRSELGQKLMIEVWAVLAHREKIFTSEHEAKPETFYVNRAWTYKARLIVLLTSLLYYISWKYGKLERLYYLAKRNCLTWLKSIVLDFHTLADYQYGECIVYKRDIFISQILVH